MWRLKHEAFGPYGPDLGWGYDGDPISSPGRRDAPVPPLDPVDATLVGHLRTGGLRAFCERSGLSVLSKLLSIPADPEEVGYFRKVTWGGKVPVVGERYHDHFRVLVACGLLIPSSRQQCRHWSNYFAVEKTRETTRAIFNGKRLSIQCPTPPPVNLVEPVRLLQRIQEHARRHGRVELVAGDFRHWFHQIPVSPALRQLFGLRDSRGHDYHWGALPMGWSWSPCIAQAHAWAVLMYAEQGEKSLFDLSGFKDEGAQLPSFVATSSGKGFVTVYYDNFVVCTADPGEADAIAKRIKRVCESLHAVIKEGSFARITQQELHNKPVQLLGIELKTLPGLKGRTRAIQCRPAKLDVWSSLPPPEEQVSCRSAAEYVGRSLFAASLIPGGLRRTSLGRSGLGLAREIGKHAWRSGWEGTVELPALKKLWRSVLDLKDSPIVIDVSQTTEKSETRTMILSTDASSKGFGWAIFDDSDALQRGAATARHEGTWEDPQEHIYFKELRCALMGLRDARRRHEKMQFQLVVDNSAVAWALQHGFSSSLKGTSIMDEYEEELSYIAGVTLVISQDNPGDCPSRACEDRSAYKDWMQRCQQLHRALEAEKAGWRWSSCKVEEYQRRTEEALRHAGPADELRLNEDNEWEES